ncbi:unnamed protein product [Spirodela intermedia]|uniref:Uncharacterized protein n=2 Tax=Spirodela intermedia TaxID=51605 RepID=A0A7I8JVX0_SPIIN|nr:unnamed protein product [Spirodela intermedia]CAA6653559.1 unnamed protein product [Spirodela intermedia]CAA7387829.1 unnamed protein product [Spirodela intermedia]
MDEMGNDDEFLSLRIKQLERERDDLQKDVERMCLQQAGPSYLSAATRMHFQRTAGSEEENENLRKKLAACVRDNKNLQEELSEAYRIKGQLADLHAAAVSKNMEVEKQIKFFQSCVASAFAERDSSIIEAEKAKEQWETLSEKLCDYGNRLQELQSSYDGEKKLNSTLQVEMEKLKEQNKIFEEVISKFSEIRESATGCSDSKPLEVKCSTLLNDPSEIWIFGSNGKHGHSNYIASLEEQVATLRESVDSLQKKMRMGMDIERYLRGRVRSLEKKQVQAEDKFRHSLSTLREFLNQQRCSIMTILEEESIEMRSILVELQEEMRLVHMKNDLESLVPTAEEKCNNSEEGTADITSDADYNVMVKDPSVHDISIYRECSSDVLAQVLREKVETLLLLSQEEERHLLERDLNVALQKRIEDLQRSLVQVTSEKVQALVSLAQLKQEYHLLQVNSGGGTKDFAVQERGERLKNLLKRTYLGRWVGRSDRQSEAGLTTMADGSDPSHQKTDHSLDLTRLKAENAALREGIANVDQLASSICRLRLSLLKVIDEARSAAPAEESLAVALDGILREADSVKMVLRSALPISWSAVVEDSQPTVLAEASRSEEVDPTAAVGSEMVELLVLAAELTRDYIVPQVSTPAS